MSDFYGALVIMMCAREQREHGFPIAEELADGLRAIVSHADTFPAEMVAEARRLLEVGQA